MGKLKERVKKLLKKIYGFIVDRRKGETVLLMFRRVPLHIRGTSCLLYSTTEISHDTFCLPFGFPFPT